MHRTHHRLLLPALAAALALPMTAQAAGYDTPMLYSARHMGMGGVAIGSVDDPSAGFHNPAGLARVQKGALTLDFSPLIGTIKGTPSAESGNLTSNTTFAPFFLAGAAWRVHERVVLGLTVFPVASAGAGYTYSYKDGKDTATADDRARLAFIEIAPGLAVNLAPGLSFGAVFRASTVSFERERTNTTNGTDNKYIDLNMKGWNYKGFRAGLQFTHGDWDLGLVYRNGITADLTDDRVLDPKNATAAPTLTGIPADHVQFQFILPSKFGLGVQYRGIDRLRLGLDLEYTLNSENSRTEVSGYGFGQPPRIPVANISEWKNSVTIRTGAGYQVAQKGEVRLGFVHDMQATNPLYPSAFGTPPAATQIVTAGFGWSFLPNLDVSVAAAYRHGAATVTTVDDACKFCGKPGQYEVNLMGAYVDLRWRFGGDAAPIKTIPQVEEPKSGADATPAPAPVAPEAVAPAAPAVEGQPHA